MQDHNPKKIKRGDRSSTEDDLSIAKKANMASESENECAEDLEGEPSLSEIKGILNDIQQSISSILKDNMTLKENLAQLKSSFGSQAREIDKLKQALETSKKENETLRNELDVSKSSLVEQINEIEKVYDQMDELEQYSRKNTIEIHGIPEDAYESTEYAVMKVAEALAIPLNESEIEISHKLKRKGNRPIIVKFVSHKIKSQLYKARTKLKNVKMSDLFPNYCSSIQSSERIYINENLTQFRRNLVNEASKLKRNRGGPVLNLWTIDGKIFVKTSPGGAPVRIYSTGDLSDL